MASAGSTLVWPPPAAGTARNALIGLVPLAVSSTPGVCTSRASMPIRVPLYVPSATSDSYLNCWKPPLATATWPVTDGALALPETCASALSRPEKPRFISASFSSCAMSTFLACTSMPPICGLSPSEKLPSTSSA